LLFANRPIDFCFQFATLRAMRLAFSRFKLFPPLGLAAWIALALLTLSATGCAEFSAQKAENSDPFQNRNRLTARQEAPNS